MADHAARTTARLFDFLHRRTPWHRRLWGIGTVLSLHEVVEYSRFRRAANLPADGLTYVTNAVRREVALDPGAAHVAPDLDTILAVGAQITPHQESQLEHLAQRVDNGYLERWASATGGTTSPPAVERTARLVASHLLDKGFSSDHLYRWLDADRHGNANPDLPRVLNAAATMCTTTPPRRYEVIVPCVLSKRPSRLPSAVQWMDAEQTSRRLDELKPDRRKVRQSGAFILTVTERDPWAAVESANDLMARVTARVHVGQPGTSTIRAADVAYVIGNDREFRLQPPRRQLDIHALHRQGAVYDIDPTDARQLDDALDLAAYLEVGGAGAAVTGGWAAVEGLLLHPGERIHVTAADRLAMIVACSIGRAELTPLAFRHQEHGQDDVANRLRSMGPESSNYERVRVIEEHLRSGGDLALPDASDQAALERVQGIIADPVADLGRIRTYIQDTFRRLYNQRNLVMHSGSFRSIVLSATLRTAPPLVGAGLDRIVHAQLSSARPTSPLELSARAESELGLLGTSGQRWIIDLLEP